MPTTALPTLRLHLAEALQVRKLIVEGGGGGSIEITSPLDPKALLLVKAPPKDMLSYFGRAPSSARAWPSLSPSPLSSGVKRQAAVVTGQGVAAAGFGSSHGGGGAGRKRSKTGAAFGKGGRGGVGSAAEGAATLFGSPRRPVIAAAAGAAALFGSRTRPVTPGGGGGGGGGSRGGSGGGGGGEAEVISLAAVESGTPEVIAIDD